MNWTWSEKIRLGGSGRIHPDDVRRQERTAQEILRRLDSQPGVVLADEVGMGKTFVALAVACAVVESTGGGQVVIMVPGSVGEKWPREWTVFRDKCLAPGTPIRASEVSVSNAIDFLKKLDDPPSTRCHIVFATHNALAGQLRDPFVKLALLSRVLRRGSLTKQRSAFPEWAGTLIDRTWFRHAEIVGKLLNKPPHLWRALWNENMEPELDDDPVPQAVLEALDLIRFDKLASALQDLPYYRQDYNEARYQRVRTAMRDSISEIWATCLRNLDIDRPLLILDEAHHLKNPDTRLARLLSNPEGDDDSTEKGVLAGLFRRMLFLSATPFQLGHRELIQILHRFEGVRWSSPAERIAYRETIRGVDQDLNGAQLAAQRLDRVWGRLRPEDVVDATRTDWWSEPSALDEKLRYAALQIDETSLRMHQAAAALHPWVIRHLRPDRAKRRRDLPGRALLHDQPDPRGLLIEGPAVFPFLLAARAQAVVACRSTLPSQAARAYFADGLASSFEAYRETRERRLEKSIDDTAIQVPADPDPELEWYLDRIEKALPRHDVASWGHHPKVRATVHRAAELWDQGEKVVIFCFFRATCRSLRRHLSVALRSRIIALGRKSFQKDHLTDHEVWEQLDRYSKNRLQKGDPLYRAAEARVREALLGGGLSKADLAGDGTDADPGLVEPILRFFRAPAFLVRYLDLSAEDPGAAFEEAWVRASKGRLSLQEELRRFGTFLAERTESEVAAIRRSLAKIQTGEMVSRETDEENPDDSRFQYLPNVRVVNGETRAEARQNLLHAFNTPFFPEILVASSVMAEGVDLHLACRHVIHHDLDWNPSVLEQRTGRLDRLGSKSEAVKLPIAVYQPYLEATQDEKMYRVVKDRERWFNVVLGEAAPMDELSIEQVSGRVPLREELLPRLTMKLDLG